ncbi:hypothetical protein KY290_007681 [Solanum tuberosum]|uniref:Transposase-associated domain-containing protein n=1 Tax=Solanum tuberosum TaxID=4113 RepID=A0ABQ7W6R1_SOLTU|nr:hypothetical protein KY290_007681 [Solanum tuberosum]
MDDEDKSWMNCLRWTDEYIRGVNNFLDKAFERASQGNEILCPCRNCINRYWHYRNVVEDHLVADGFIAGYTKWDFHQEGFSSRNTPHPINDDEESFIKARTAIPLTKEKGGGTQMQSVHEQSERKLIVLNELYQHIGPTEAVIKESGSFLGTLAMNGTFCPLNNMPKTKKENRKKLRYPHTVGKASFAIIREAEMETIETQETEDGSQSVDAYAAVMAPDHPGRARLYGRGVTKTLLRQKVADSGPSSNVVDDERIQRKMEELEERIQQRMQEKFNAQKDNMERAVTMNIIAQLQCLNPSMLRFGVRSLGEEAALQLINRSSDGSNNQGPGYSRS